MRARQGRSLVIDEDLGPSGATSVERLIAEIGLGNAGGSPVPARTVTQQPG
ncbi:MAG: hypothetical protein WAS21_30845 [Geminicoccaceae bacterium]